MLFCSGGWSAKGEESPLYKKKRRLEAAGSFAFLPRAVPAAGRPFLRSPGLAGCCPAELARPGEQRNPAGVFAWMQMQLPESRPSSE